ncbi:hypothetical protein [Paenibacillus harenae]|uniref:hypothetical protein n=1 Tax=Paenibacillus harenae TaxID=306543 RepID=UPI0027918BF8|nr:hypothetical protein [Paenibacillus harenae]MDQ0063553.1 hypothetical protein [Paenibacillus harenae]
MRKNDRKETKPERCFSKSQLTAARRYSTSDKDVLAAVLDEDETYSHEQATKLISAYLTKEVM